MRVGTCESENFEKKPENLENIFFGSNFQYASFHKKLFKILQEKYNF